MRFVKGFAVIVLLAMSLAACSKGYEDKSAVLAKVNGTPVTQLALDHFLRAQKGIAVPESEGEKRQAIEQLVTTQLLVQEALNQGMDKREDVYLAVKINREAILARAVIGKYLQDNPVTENDMKAYYAELSKQEQYKVRHILLPSEEKAKEVIAAIKAGKAFAKLAAQSLDVDSGKRGGDIGWIGPNIIAPVLYTTAASLKNGGIAGTPVKSEFGWHVIRRDASQLPKLPPYEQISDQLRERLQGERIDTLARGLRERANIVINGK